MVRRWSTVPISLSYTTLLKPLLNFKLKSLFEIPKSNCIAGAAVLRRRGRRLLLLGQRAAARLLAGQPSARGVRRHRSAAKRRELPRRAGETTRGCVLPLPTPTHATPTRRSPPQMDTNCTTRSLIPKQLISIPIQLRKRFAASTTHGQLSAAKEAQPRSHALTPSN